jgi:hypothetical protein
MPEIEDMISTLSFLHNEVNRVGVETKLVGIDTKVDVWAYKNFDNARKAHLYDFFILNRDSAKRGYIFLPI